jgi:trk system potassium uptake protein TrkH
MNYKLIFKLIGNVLGIQTLFMLFPLIISIVYKGDDRLPFIISILIISTISFLLIQLKPTDKNFRTKESFTVTGLSWLSISIFGALPFLFSGYFNNIVDCLFESISGFTTTGASILTDIEALPKGILFWRSFTNWIGGVGVLLFMMAIMPSMNASSINLLRAESSGPSPDKIVPKIRETAIIIYLIYISMTVLLIFLFLIAGLPIYDALVNSFTTAGTGGFSTLNSSIAGYNNLAVEILITVFMFLFGISFTLYFYLFSSKYIKFFKDSELKFYFFVIVVSIIIITFNISGLYGGLIKALRYSSFQVSSIISTAGFSNIDYSTWPTLSHVIILFLMITGCCAGSTGGGIKLVRILLLLKLCRIELNKYFHPKSVEKVIINGKQINNDIILKTGLFFFLYFIIFLISVLFISLEDKDLLTIISSVVSALSNIGPALGIAGPAGNYSSFSPFSKIILCFCMMAGRLEIFPILLIFAPSIWKEAFKNFHK